MNTYLIKNATIVNEGASFLSDILGIENLIPLYHVASYLNITPVQLSRIRKNLHKTK